MLYNILYRKESSWSQPSHIRISVRISNPIYARSMKMSAADYDSLMETLRVCQNSYLHDKIQRGMDQIRSGGTPHPLMED